jgi:L-iditol 2-dehydrogenase
VKVARSVSPREVVVEDAPAPRAGPGDVVIRMLACGICKTDVLDWYVERKLPRVLGHELAGEVVEAGEGVEDVAPGDAVAVHHHSPCGECRRCRRGHETLCERFRSARLDPGGFAELVRVPADLAPGLLRLDGLDPVAATFVEPLACVVRSQDRAGLRGGDSLLVVGAGANGLLQIAAAHARAVDAVWVREPRPERLARAEEWGAEHHGNEQVDVAIVCTPEAEAIAEAARHVAPGGTLCLYAPPPPGTPLPVEGEPLFMRELTVTASYAAGPGDMRSALDLLQAGTVDPLPLVTHRLGLDETARAFELARSGEALKAVVVKTSST